MKILFCLLAVSLVSFVPVEKHPKSVHSYIFQYENVLGTSMTLKVFAASQTESDKAETAVLKEISRLSAILSGYDPNSEFSRWFRTSGRPEKISNDLYNVLTLFDRWRERTGGALDASAEVVTKCWKTAAAQNRTPTAEELHAAVSAVRQPHWSLEPVGHTATHLSNVPLMLNSFAKSYIIRHAADAGLAAAKSEAIVVNIGGDLVVSGRHTEDILVSDPKSDAENDLPLDRVRVSNRAVATSGNYRRGELIGGKWHSHIVDPRTGQPADSIISATVIAPNATDAGALATAFNVMTPDESIILGASFPETDYLIITAAGRRIESPRWKTLTITAAASRAPVPTPVTTANFEMIVSMEINLQTDGPAKRPYVAVWVEDESHAPVRTISVWHGSDRYLPELKSWFLKYRDMYNTDKSFNGSVTSATRSAGKYSVKWDGRDDHGNPVKPGKYVIKIEAAREHGTYRLMRQEIDCDATSKVIPITGNNEISAASLDYRVKQDGN